MNSMETSTESSKIGVGSVGIFWDIESCPIPSGVNPEDVPVNIRFALCRQPLIGSKISSFSAYGVHHCFPPLRKACFHDGVKVVDFPSASKEAGYKGMLFDLFLFALDHPPPSSIVVISDGGDFVRALQALGQRGYTVLLMVSFKDPISSMFQKTSHFLWDWPTVACSGNAVDPGWQCGLTPKLENKLQLAQPVDLEGLKRRVMMLLIAVGGSLSMAKFSTEYAKMYGRVFQLKHYGVTKVIQVLNKFNDAVTVTGKGNDKMIVLRQQCRKYSASGSSIVDVSGLAVEDKVQCPQAEVSEELRKQVVKLMKEAGGSLSLKKFPLEYAKMFGLSSLAKYGTEKLVTMLDMIEDVVTKVEEGKIKMILLKKEKGSSNTREEREIGFVKPGDVEELKKQLVNMLKAAGGSLCMSNLRRYFSIMYGHELSLTERGVLNIGKLLGMNVVTVVRDGKQDIITLKGFEEGNLPSAKRKRLQ